MNQPKRIAVIGAGAAGSMAAIAAAQNGAQVTLFEKNEKVGKKIYITGKGRCNVTNATPYPAFFDRINTNEKFLFSALYTFTNDNVIDFFEQAGVPIKIERGNRAFPNSDHSNDINRGLERTLKNAGVTIKLHKEIEKIEPEAHAFRIEDEIFDALIVATGGLSYPTTGSTGDGYRFAKQLGHAVTPLMPALVAMDLADEDLRDWEGVAIKNVELHAMTKESDWVERGEMLFTKNGISGPIVLTLSSRIAGHANDVEMWIDWKPALQKEALHDRLLREFTDAPNKSILHILDRLLPKRTVYAFVARIDMVPEKKAHEITKEERTRIVEMLKHFPLAYAGNRSFREAVITKGGVSVDDIDPHTMESRIVPGLYFAGEVIDVDALTGGYNLQIAFSTGYLAGLSAAFAEPAEERNGEEVNESNG